jgi:hypothetical protein
MIGLLIRTVFSEAHDLFDAFLIGLGSILTHLGL